MADLQPTTGLTWPQARYYMLNGVRATRQSFGGKDKRGSDSGVWYRHGLALGFIDSSSGTRVVQNYDLTEQEYAAADWMLEVLETVPLPPAPPIDLVGPTTEPPAPYVPPAVTNIYNPFVGWGDPHWELIKDKGCARTAMVWDDNVSATEMLLAYAEDEDGKWFSIHYTCAAYTPVPGTFAITSVRVQHDTGSGTVTATYAMADITDPVRVTLPKLADSTYTVAHLRLVNEGGNRPAIGFAWLFGSQKMRLLGGAIFFAQQRFLAANGRILLLGRGANVDGWLNVLQPWSLARADFEAASAAGRGAVDFLRVCAQPAGDFFTKMVSTMAAVEAGLVDVPVYTWDPLHRASCGAWDADDLIPVWQAEIVDEYYA